jgi:predicted dehydrogenase
VNRVRAAVIGAGYLGRYHAQKYASMEDVELLGVVDTDFPRAETVAAEVGTRGYASIEDLPARPDAVSVAVPTTVHAEVSIPLLKQGIDVLVEKPISANLAEARAIIEAADAGDAKLQVGHLERFNPALVSLAGEIRNPMFIEAHRISPFKARGADVDVVLDLMIHDIDIILSLVPSEVSSIESVGVPVLTDSVDIANARIRFRSGCIANVTASRVSADTMRKIRIFQSNSYISIDFAKASVEVFTLDEHRHISHNHLAMSESDALGAEIRSFVDAVKGVSPVHVDGRAAYSALEVACTIKEAMIIPKEPTP